MNSRLPLALALTALASAALCQEVRYNVLVQGKKAGSAVMKLAKIPSGLQVSQTLKIDAQKVTVVGDETYDQKGNTVKNQMKISGPQGTVTMSATFSGDMAVVVVVQPDGKKVNRSVPKTGKLPRTDGSVYWFVRDIPKVGTKLQFDDFDLQRMSWNATTITYKGKKALKVGGKTVNANYLEQTDGSGLLKVYLDDKGQMLRLESPNLVLEKAG